MAYTPINWQTGDTITAEKMNKMDNGWGVQTTQLFSEAVTVTKRPIGEVYSALFSYSGSQAPTQLNITFNGNNYVCERTEVEGAYIYDEEGLFEIATGASGNPWTLITFAAGTYSVSASGQLLNTSDGFSQAVNQCVDTTLMPFLCVDGITTADEINGAWETYRMLYFYSDDGLRFVTNIWDDTFEILPTSTAFSVGYDENGIFTITYN